MPNQPPEAPGPRFTAQLTGLDDSLPGPRPRRFMRCGKTNCRCKSDPPTLHGPYLHWTRTVAGKTVTRSLTPDQARRYQAWFDNARRIRDLLGELEARSLRAFDDAEGGPRKCRDITARKCGTSDTGQVLHRLAPPGSTQDQRGPAGRGSGGPRRV